MRRIDRREGHAAARRLLAARMDGLLTATETRFLAEHLTGCVPCRSVARAYQEGHEALHALRPTVPPRDLGARIGAALDREMAGAQRTLRLPQGLPRPSAALVGPVVAGASAVIVLVVGARLLLAPPAAPATGPGSTAAAMVSATPAATPFAVPAAELALVEQGSEGLTVYRAAVSEMCPTTSVDCATTAYESRRMIGIASDLVPRGVAIDRENRRMALLAEDPLGADTVSVVVLPPIDERADPRGAGPGPDGRWPVAGAGGSPGNALASLSPGGGVVPADAPARVLAVLEGVQAVGAPPAWSPDGSMLAFSAMPVDRSRGPDIYLWRPGQDRARRLTTDHGSWFASWSGGRVVVSRLERGGGRQVADTVLVDPADGAEEVAHLLNAWLPSVDPSGRFAVAWRGTLTGGLAQVRPRSGGLSLVDWQVVDPGASSGATPLAMLGPAGPRRATGPAPAPARAPSAWLESIEPGSRDAPAALDWEVQWATSGTTFGYWLADARGASWGRLTVLRVLPDARRIDRDATLLGPTLARRSFSLGEERIAWVAPADEGADGELHVRTWGGPGEGSIRIRDIRLRDGIPAF